MRLHGKSNLYQSHSRNYTLRWQFEAEAAVGYGPDQAVALETYILAEAQCTQ